MVTWILAIFFTFGLSLSPYLGQSKIHRHIGYKLVISLFALIGGIGFWGNVLSASGELDWLPPSFEWPVGFAKGIVSTEDNIYIVPVTSSGRVQIYKSDWTFLRGWPVNAHGGDFGIQYSNGNTFEVLTARGQKIYEYNLQGQLISEDTYDSNSLSSRTSSGQNIYVPTFPLMFIWSKPFFSLFFAFMAMLMVKAGQDKNLTKDT